MKKISIVKNIIAVSSVFILSAGTVFAEEKTLTTDSVGNFNYQQEGSEVPEVSLFSKDIDSIRLLANNLGINVINQQNKYYIMNTSLDEKIDKLNNDFSDKSKFISAIQKSGMVSSIKENSEYYDIISAVNTQIPSNLTMANADNVSKDKYLYSAASKQWIKGTGSDNDKSYSSGYEKGLEEALAKSQPKGCHPVYTYHTHVIPDGGVITTNNGVEMCNIKGGCYTVPVYHKHTGNPNSDYYIEGNVNETKTDGCYTITTKYAETTNSYWSATVTDRPSWAYTCTRCKAYYFGNTNYQNLPSHQHSIVHTELTCGITENTIIGYTTGCGKTAGTSVDKIELVFD